MSKQQRFWIRLENDPGRAASVLVADNGVVDDLQRAIKEQFPQLREVAHNRLLVQRDAAALSPDLAVTSVGHSSYEAPLLVKIASSAIQCEQRGLFWFPVQFRLALQSNLTDLAGQRGRACRADPRTATRVRVRARAPALRVSRQAQARTPRA